MAPAIVRAQASDLPSGPIRIILPTQSGGQADTIGRLIGDRVGAAIDRTFVMEPKPGAGGLIAGEYVARAAPDGNTLLFVTGGHTVAAGLYAKTIKFDAVKDFAFVCQITEASFALGGGRGPSGEIIRQPAGDVEARAGQIHVQQHRRRLDAASDRRDSRRDGSACSGRTCLTRAARSR